MSKVFTAVFAITVLWLTSAQANPPAAVTTCMGCHGPQGISANPLWPNLAGQKEGYLAKQLNDFKVGNRKDPMMNPMVQSLSSKDIEELAKYFSELK